MQKPTLMAVAVVLGLTPAACGSGPDMPEAGTSDQEQQVGASDVAGARETVAAFHRALSEADSAGALALLHPDAIIHESGSAETVEEYRAHHLPADIRFAAATEREVLSEELAVLGSGVLLLSRTRIHGRMGDREIDAPGVETMVLIPEGDRWLIRHIHWSSR